MARPYPWPGIDVAVLSVAFKIEHRGHGGLTGFTEHARGLFSVVSDVLLCALCVESFFLRQRHTT